MLAIDAGGVVWPFFPSSITSLFFIPLSGRRPIYTEILFQRAVKPKTTNQTQNNQQTNGTIIDHDQTMCRTRTATTCTIFTELCLFVHNKYKTDIGFAP